MVASKGQQGQDRQCQSSALANELRVALTTKEAAHHLNRAQNTLRIWAMRGGPITPLRINGRLAWPVAEIKRLLGVEA
jgi:1,2-phenylacetyl-CoA epoxidase PaaB subunit